jgi:predicted GNAT family N-acyltransferase
MPAEAPGWTFSIELCNWALGEARLRAVRHAVFVVEQNIPDELEWDGIDRDCRHALALDAAGQPIGCGRLLPDGHIGRMAVHAGWRGRGVGGALLACLIEQARIAGHARTILNAQTAAMPFYARHGYLAVGPEYTEAGIPHRTMERAFGSLRR